MGIKLNKIIIEAHVCQFKLPFAAQYQTNYPAPPPSVVNGILQVLYNENIDDYIVGYTFKYTNINKEIFNVWKRPRYNDNQRLTMEPCKRELFENPKLIIYTDLPNKLNINYSLTLGRANVGSLAKVSKPKLIELENRAGFAYNQFTPINVGTGVIHNIAIENKYNEELNMYDTIKNHMRFNKKIKLDKFYDEELEENIVLFKKEGAEFKCLV